MNGTLASLTTGDFAWIVGAVVLTVLALAATLMWVAARRRLRLETTPHSIHFAETSDGWRIALHRHLPAATRTNELPVVLCHGLGANRFNLDFNERRSLARYLCSRGYDVWVIELRGAGMSHAIKRQALDGYCFDDYVDRDLPVALQYILKVTQAPKVNWAGHSMGGMVMYAGLPQGLDRYVHAVATVGSPGTFRSQRSLRWLLPLMAPSLLLPPSWSRALVRALAPLAGHVRLPLTGLLGNLETIEAEVQRQTLFNLVDPVAPGVLRQFIGWVWGDGRLTCNLRQRDYSAGLVRITQPMLFIAGERDGLAPPAAVRYAFERVSSAERELVVCSKANGFSADYGHGDLILGDHAPSEVFTVIEGFLWRHRHGEVIEPQQLLKRA